MAKILPLNSVLSCPRRPVCPNSHRAAQSQCAGTSGRRLMFSARAYKVDIETQTGVETITVEEGETILQAALDKGIELTHDCKMGVCMTCPARLVSWGLDSEAEMNIWKLEFPILGMANCYSVLTLCSFVAGQCRLWRMHSSACYPHACL